MRYWNSNNQSAFVLTSDELCLLPSSVQSCSGSWESPNACPSCERAKMGVNPGHLRHRMKFPSICQISVSTAPSPLWSLRYTHVITKLFQGTGSHTETGWSFYANKPGKRIWLSYFSLFIYFGCLVFQYGNIVIWLDLSWPS